jgi:hypothetical protein
LPLSWGRFPRDRRKRPCMLVEGFSVFGVEVQYWMPIASLVLATFVAFAVWTTESRAKDRGLTPPEDPKPNGATKTIKSK